MVVDCDINPCPTQGNEGFWGPKGKIVANRLTRRAWRAGVRPKTHRTKPKSFGAEPVGFCAPARIIKKVKAKKV